MSLGVHMMTGEFLLHLLERAHKGEDPDLILAEVWANASHISADPDDEDDDV